MHSFAIRRFCVFTILFFTLQTSLPADAHAGWFGDAINLGKAVIKDVFVDNPGKTLAAAVTGAVVGNRLGGPIGAILGAGISTTISVYQDLTASHGSGADGPPGSNPDPPSSGALPSAANNPSNPQATRRATVRTTTVPGAPANTPANTAAIAQSQAPAPSPTPSATPGAMDPGSMATADQTTNTDARWGTDTKAAKGGQTGFFSSLTGEKDAYVGVVSPGKGLEVPGFWSGTVCEGSQACAALDKRAAGPGQPAADALASGLGEQGSWGGAAGRSGGGSPSADVGAYGRGAGGNYSPPVLPDGSTPRDIGYTPPPPDDFDNKLAPLIAHPAANAADQQEQAAELLSSAMEELNGRDFERAIDDLTRALKLDPKNPNLYAYRAMAFNLTGNFPAAEKDALAAIKLDPNNEKAWESLAWAQLKQGKYAEAAESATKLMGLNPKNALAYAIRAFAREKLGDNKGKLVDIKRAAELDRRYVAFAERAKKGQPIFDPRADLSSLLLERGMPPKGVGFWGGFSALFIILFAVGSFASLLRYVYLFKKGRVHDFKDFLAKMIRGRL